MNFLEERPIRFSDRIVICAIVPAERSARMFARPRKRPDRAAQSFSSPKKAADRPFKIKGAV
jgi:hypothetical protein